jgi:predicted RNA polymerase sigma factor
MRQLLPQTSEVAGLLALMLLTHARRAARTGSDGELIPLTEQNRALWDQSLIAEGIALISAALPKGEVGNYQIQAAIAALHDEAACVEDTDWPQILALYEILLRISDNPMVRLNHAIAAAMVKGPVVGMKLLDELGESSHHRFAATRAHFLEMMGDAQTAIHHYVIAADRTTNLPERNYLLERAAKLRVFE